MKCKKYVQTHFWKNHLCALSFLVCARLMTCVCVCAHTRAQLRGNIGHVPYLSMR